MTTGAHVLTPTSRKEAAIEALERAGREVAAALGVEAGKTYVIVEIDGLDVGHLRSLEPETVDLGLRSRTWDATVVRGQRCAVNARASADGELPTWNAASPPDAVDVLERLRPITTVVRSFSPETREELGLADESEAGRRVRA